MSPSPAAPVGTPLPVPGTYNFRDLGGLPLRGGGTTAPGRVFRSDALHRLDGAGRARLAGLGVTRLVDLRRDNELAKMPSAVDPAVVDIVHIPVFEDAAPERQLRSVPGPDLPAIYAAMIEDRGERLALAAEQIAHASGAVAFHCTAGKDRTGVLAALILDAVGAEREAVVADYAASARNLTGEWANQMLAHYDVSALAAQGLDILALAVQSPAWLIAEVLDRVDSEHGGGAEYLRAHGLSGEALDALVGRLGGRG